MASLKNPFLKEIYQTQTIFLFQGFLLEQMMYT